MIFGRRLQFVLLVLVSQLLLIGISVAWCIQLVLVAKHGQVVFVEENSAVLYTEVVATSLIVLFAAIVFTLQYRRLRERRRSDNKENSS